MDPLEQYLNDKSGGDPLADYLNKQTVAPEEGGPESFLHPEKFKPSPIHRKFNNTGPLEEISPSFVNHERIRQAEARTHGKGVVERAAAPINDLLDKATFGGYSALLRGGDTLPGIADLRAEEGHPVQQPEIARRTVEGIEDYRTTHPTLSMYTGAPAYFMKPTQSVAQGVERLIPEFSNPLLRAARATAVSGGTGAAIGGAEAALRGEGLREGGEDILRGGEGGLMTGAAIAGPLSLLGAAARGVANSRGGKARQFLEQHGVEVGPTTAGRGGPMESMATTGRTDADIGQQAEVSAKRSLDMLNEEKRGVLGTLGRRYGSIANKPEAAQLEDVSGIVTKMREAAQELDTHPQARAALQDLIKSVETKQGEGFNPETDNYMLSATDLNKLRRALDRQARTGVSTDEKLSPIKSAANEARGMVAEGPYAQTNADYAKEAKYYQQSRKMLGINERPKTPEETKTAVNTVRHLIERPGQNTVTAGGQAKALADFKERHPNIAEEMSRPEILRKRADISFSLLPKRHGGLIERTGSGIGGLATAEGVMHALGSGHIDLKKAGLAAALGLTLQNMPALQARYLYAPAMEALRLEPVMFGNVPLFQAARNSMENR